MYRNYTTSLLNIIIQSFILPANVSLLQLKNKKVSFISSFILKAWLCLSCRVPLVPLAVQVYAFFIFLISNNRILHCFTILSHCIFAINKHKGERHYIDENKNTICLSRRVPLVQPIPSLYCYRNLTQCQEICTIFIPNYFE